MKTAVCLTLALCVLLVLIGVGGVVALEARRGSLPTPVDLVRDVSGPGRLVLDIEGVDVAIDPGPSGDPIRVEGELDAAVVELVPEFSTSGDRGWTYRLQAQPSSLLKAIAHGGGSGSSIHITLPRDVPIALEGVIDGGEKQIELGGLWVTETDLTFGRGDQRIAFSQPLRQPMERLYLDAPFGELTLVELGNASPREVRISKKVGDACVVLRGAWRADATIEIACGVASCDLHEPGEGDAVARLAAGDSGVEDPGLPQIEVRATGVLPDNVAISDQL